MLHHRIASLAGGIRGIPVSTGVEGVVRGRGRGRGWEHGVVAGAAHGASGPNVGFGIVKFKAEKHR